MERKKVVVTLKPVTYTIPADWSDETVDAWIGGMHQGGAWQSWTYEDEWRN